MKTEDVQKLYSDFVLPTYTYMPVCLVKGKGSYVWDIEGNRYLDFFPGWAVSGIGHCHPRVVSALKSQSDKMLHISNNFLNLKQALLAKEISEASFPSHVFFCNSGAEAIEAAVKFARKKGNPLGKYEIVTMKKSFHGRTLAALTATGQAHYHNGFDPLPQGFLYAEFNNVEALEQVLTKKTAAIIIEPVQGEGGINVASKEYLKQIRHICDKENILLVFDEVQTGMGRTGKMFGYQHSDVVPDLMTLAKSLGGGVPIGALVVNNKIENVLVPGTHASTFGGNPLVAAAALAVFKAIKKDRLLENAVTMGEYLKTKLLELKETYGFFTEVRGLGVMLGVECKEAGARLVAKALKKGLYINCTQGNVLRIVPPITVTKKQIDTAMKILAEALGEMV
jgi:predicted acetylornithine/succinylornithine family transaminase